VQDTKRGGYDYWQYMASYNTYAEKSARERGVVMHMLRDYDMLSRRCDRVDQVHFCVLGAPAVLIRLLYALLVKLQP
jgi:hypothetical protein